jgi:predicted O-methyltransferase YrrM
MTARSLLKSTAKAILPRALINKATALIEQAQLRVLPAEKIDPSPLRPARELDFQRTFDDPRLHASWANDGVRIADVLPFENLADGVNPGDRRALYYIVAALKPERVLEVGTHIGASTVAMAQALRTHASARATLTTVDIEDVNDAATGAFARAGLTSSPAQNLAALGLHDTVRFLARPAAEVLRSPIEKFDLIFLDGRHSAAGVYREVSAALDKLRPGGVIALHDYYPESRSAWSNDAVIAGPRVAVERLTRECGQLCCLPLGHLPWQTTRGQNFTTLAVLARR